MRKHISFGLAAFVVALSLILLGAFNAGGTTADTVRARAGTPYVALVGSFLPVKNLEPVW
jgi:hypothetical protein